MRNPVGTLLAPEDQEQALAQAMSRLRGTPSLTGYEVRAFRKDGERVSLRLTVSPITLAEGRVLQGTVEDITERKRAKEALEQQAVELERSNAELEQFAYLTSHDLREPLRMVSSYLELVERRYGDRLDEKGHRFIAHAVDGATRMHELINGLLAYSRAGSQGKDLEPVDCEAVLEQVLADLEVAIEDSGAEITHDPLPTVMADGVQLRQVFQNLIDNAIKFYDERPPRVHITSRRDGEQRVFSVQDSGIGIDSRQAGRLFEVFQRLHTREEYAGVGIGLAICKKIVERHGGRIWVESEPGQGATFNFTLPDRGDVS
jgi:light-regulated signal transduction histidine kinase (bacteriophytochrome)